MRHCRSLLVVVVALVFLVFPAFDAAAFFTALKYSIVNQGKREQFSFAIPPGAQKPTLEMVEPTRLLLTVPGVLALPASALNIAKSPWVESFSVQSIPEQKMGIWVTIGLRKPNLNFRETLGPEDPVNGSVYQFEIDEESKPDPTAAMQIKEGQLLPGRDGTLFIVSHTGSTEIGESVEKGSNPVVRVHMKAARMADTWRPIAPGGLVENVFVYEFPEGHAELEVLLNEKANAVYFHKSDKAGYFIVEILGPRDIGRSSEAKQIIAARESDLEREIVKPLNRLFPHYEASSETVVLVNKAVTEDYFWSNAKGFEKDRRYDKARGYLGSLLETFPDTPNLEVIDFKRLDLARRMGWKPGWLLGELEAAMARHPNSPNYSQHRFMQLQLLNGSGRFESALSMMTDPNLPREKVPLWLERAKTNIGLAKAHPGDPKFAQNAEADLQQVLTQTAGQGGHAALSLYLLAGVHDMKQDREATFAALGQLTAQHLGYLGMEPGRLMGIADFYYKYGDYPKAFQYYSSFMDAFPTQARITPWAMLRAAESSFQLSRKAEAQNTPEIAKERFEESKRLFARLQKQFSGSDAAVWGKIFQLSMERELTFKQRLEKLDKIIKTIALPNALSEAYLLRAELLGNDGQFRESIETLNQLLNQTQNLPVVRRADRLKKKLLEEGMTAALNDGRPELAALLGEVYGLDWRQNPDFSQARILLAEALMQLGDNKASFVVLENLDEPAAEALRQLGQALGDGDWLQSARKEGKLGGAMTREVARVRLAEANRLLSVNEWEAVQLLLDPLPEGLLDGRDKDQRLRFLAKAELGRGRFPHAVKYLEYLLANRPMGDGLDYYGYASVIQLWKGDDKALDSFVKVADEATDKEIRALANIRVGDILQKAGNFAEAKGRYKQAAELAPGTSWAKVSTENASQLEMAMEAGR
ncbi:MAG: Tetratricopeptide TPR 2 repeat protein [Magnetococcales bacterium]|nr:Tetratricopeptide TPR 2 repeat protein [Magnetococcales bacterium]